MMLEIEMAHQTPFTPKKLDSSIAAGIRNEVNTIDTILGGSVFPSPLNAPCVAISKHMKNCEKPKIFK